MNSSSNNNRNGEGTAADLHYTTTTVMETSYGYPRYPGLDVQLNSVTCTFETRCILPLKRIARRSSDTTYCAKTLTLRMNIRLPFSVAMIKASGLVTVTGCASPVTALDSAQQVVLALSATVPGVGLHLFQDVSSITQCTLPFVVDVEALCRLYPDCTMLTGTSECMYFGFEPTTKITIHAEGRTTIETRKLDHIQSAIFAFFPRCIRLALPYHRRSVTENGTINGMPISDGMYPIQVIRISYVHGG